MGRDSRSRGDNRKDEVGIQAALAWMDQSAVDSGRLGVRRHRRRELLRARRRKRQTTLGCAAWRCCTGHSHLVCGRWEAICRRFRRLRAVCLRSVEDTFNAETAEVAEKFVMLLKATTKARRHEESQPFECRSAPVGEGAHNFSVAE